MAALITFWGLVGIGTGIQSWLVAARPALPSLGDFVLHQCLSAAPWLPATPVIMWAGSSYPIGEGSRWRIVSHLVAALATAAVVNVMMAGLYAFTGSPFAVGASVPMAAAAETLRWAHVVVVVYAAIAVFGWWIRPRTEATRDATPIRPPDDAPIRLREGGGTFIARPVDIDWLEADGDHVRVHLGDRVHLVDHTLTALTDRLEPHGFARIHRSSLVNTARIRSLQPVGRGDREALLRCGTRLRVARRRVAALEDALNRRHETL